MTADDIIEHAAIDGAMRALNAKAERLVADMKVEGDAAKRELLRRNLGDLQYIAQRVEDLRPRHQPPPDAEPVAPVPNNPPPTPVDAEEMADG